MSAIMATLSRSHCTVAPEKSKCFHHMVEMVSRLSSENITYLADTYIRPEATTLDEQLNRDIIIDALGATATEVSQTLLTELVLKSENLNASLIMRTLIHFVELKNPPPEVFVKALEVMAIKRRVEFPGKYNDLGHSPLIVGLCNG